MHAVGDALGLLVRTGIYRAPTPAPDASWPEPDPAPSDRATGAGRSR
jgi:hypothetical protein